MEEKVKEITEENLDEISGGEYKYKTICAGCGYETSVPFPPIPNRAVYCPECWKEMNRY